MDLNALVELYGSGPEPIEGVQHVSIEDALLVGADSMPELAAVSPDGAML